MNKKTATLAFIYLLAAVTVVTYYPSLLNNIISWEDSDLFNTVSLVLKHTLSVFSRPEYPPLDLAFLAFQRSFSQYGYFLFHALSIIGHAINAILLYFIVRKLFGSERTALLVSVLFAVHPVGVGTVAWLSGQDAIFSTMFLLLASTFYLKYSGSGNTLEWWLTVVSSAFFYLIGSPALTLILVLLAMDLVLDAKTGWARISQKWPILLMWAASFSIRVSQSGGWSYLVQLYYDSIAMLRLGITEIVLRVMMPWHDTLVASADEIANQSSLHGESLYPFLFLFLVVFILWQRKKYPVLLYGLVFLVFTSLPLFTGTTSGNWVLVDRSFYLSSAGIYLALGGLLDVFLLGRENRMILRWGVYLLAGCAVFGLLSVSRARAKEWKDNVTFWGTAHEENPKNTFILAQRGMYHYSKYEIAPALADLSAVVRLAPEEADSYIDRGIVRLDAYDYADAVSDFKEAIQLRPTDQQAFYDLGLAYTRSSLLDSAEPAFTRAIQLNPAFAQAYEGRANVLARLGKYVLAFADYRRALDLDPQYAEAYGNRAFAFLQTGNFSRGLEDFRRQIDLAPYKIDAKIHYGYTALLLGDTATALSVFTDALRADSTNGKMYLLGVSNVFLKYKEETQAGERIFRQIGVR